MDVQTFDLKWRTCSRLALICAAPGAFTIELRILIGREISSMFAGKAASIAYHNLESASWPYCR